MNMFAVFEEEKLFSILMLAFFAGGIILQVVLAILYQNMIDETDNMTITKNKTLKQCKTKFANCFRLNDGVANIPIFTDKILNYLHVGPFSFRTLYHLSGQAQLLSVVCAGVGICRSIIKGYRAVEILPFYIAVFLGLYLYFAVSSVVDLKGRRQILKTNLVDYLENHMAPRLAETEKAGEEDGQEDEGRESPAFVSQKRAAVRKKEENTGGKSFSEKEQQELEDLLKEFLEFAK